VVGLLGIVIGFGTFFCYYYYYYYNYEWDGAISFFDGPPITSTTSSTGGRVDQSTDKYAWNGNREDDDVPYIPPAESWQRRPREKIFTTLTEQEKHKLKGMKDDFIKLQSAGKLLPCRLDEGDSCFQDIKSSAAEYFTAFLRPSSSTNTSSRRMLLHNPLPEGKV